MKNNIFIVTAIATLFSASTAMACSGPNCEETEGTGTIKVEAGIIPYAIVGLEDVSSQTLDKTDFIDADIKIKCANQDNFNDTVATEGKKPVYVKTNSCCVTMQVEPKNLEGGCAGDCTNKTTIPTTYMFDGKDLKNAVTIASQPNAGSTSVGDFTIKTDVDNASGPGVVAGIVPSGGYYASLDVTIVAH